MKQCSKCKADKDLTEFFKNSTTTDGLARQCKTCAKEYTHRPGIMKRYANRGRLNYDNKAALLVEYKKGLSCMCCGESEPSCFDFHHVDPAVKDFGIAEMIGRFSWDRILVELKKCVCVCANCHRKIHAGIMQCPSS